MLAWISLTRYIEHAKEFSFISRTLSYSLPDVFRHLINSIPIYMGFAMLGMAFFWESYRFRYFYMALYTLFALSLGDEISNTFNDIT